jgi:hypothetical protein
MELECVGCEHEPALSCNCLHPDVVGLLLQLGEECVGWDEIWELAAATVAEEQREQCLLRWWWTSIALSGARLPH